MHECVCKWRMGCVAGNQMKQPSPEAQPSPRQQRGCSRPRCRRTFVPMHHLLQPFQQRSSYRYTWLSIHAPLRAHPHATTIFLYAAIWLTEACRFRHTSAYTLQHSFKEQERVRFCVCWWEGVIIGKDAHWQTCVCEAEQRTFEKLVWAGTWSRWNFGQIIRYQAGFCF